MKFSVKTPMFMLMLMLVFMLAVNVDADVDVNVYCSANNQVAIESEQADR